ncbi:MAG: six-cysteine peptide SCIFF [Clostridia bacterium]|nr:MAG: six-cysteine peptide SCIFF [Clostridia bacterium]
MEQQAKRHIVTVVNPRLHCTLESGGCGACQVSCQSACKTSLTVGNQTCVSGRAAGQVLFSGRAR